MGLVVSCVVWVDGTGCNHATEPNQRRQEKEMDARQRMVASSTGITNTNKPSESFGKKWTDSNKKENATQKHTHTHTCTQTDKSGNGNAEGATQNKHKKEREHGGRGNPGVETHVLTGCRYFSATSSLRVRAGGRRLGVCGMVERIHRSRTKYSNPMAPGGQSQAGKRNQQQNQHRKQPKSLGVLPKADH